MQFLGLSLYTGTYKKFFSTLLSVEKPTLIFTPNPEILLRASRDSEFCDVLGRADVLVPDGNGLYLASYMREWYSYLRAGLEVFFQKKRTAKRYGELIQGSNLTRDLVHYTEKHDRHILIIDSYRITEPRNSFEIRKKYIQEHMASLLHSKYPSLSVAVFFQWEMSADAIAHYAELHHIDYIFACTGMKSQESLLIDIFSYLPANMPIIGLGVGSSFDYLLWLQHRAPIIWQRLWLEWLYRLICSPSRWQRIIDAVWRFPRSVR